MRERLTSGIAIALLLILVAATWWASDYARRSVPVDPPRRLTHEMDIYIKFFVMLSTDEHGMPTARLEGPYAEHFPDNDTYEVSRPRAISQRADRSMTIATADRGRVDQANDLIVLSQNVRLHRPPLADDPGLTITSDEVSLRPDQDIAYTDLPAIVTRGDGSQMTGVGMLYDNKTRQLTVKADARVRIAPHANDNAPAPAP